MTTKIRRHSQTGFIMLNIIVTLSGRDTRVGTNFVTPLHGVAVWESKMQGELIII